MTHWPIGDGEMAERIRSFDWAATPLGPSARWPQSLKTIVDLMLASTGLMSLVWGAEAIHLYNDAFADLLLERRVLSLGHSAHETFARSRGAFEAQFAAGMAGSSGRLLGQRYPVLRQGRLEEAWFDVDYAPLRNEAGIVAGVLWALKDTTTQQSVDQAFRAIAARHRLIVENWAQAEWETDPDGFVVVDSPSWRAYTGQTGDEWLGYGWLDAIHPDDRAFAERQWREAIEARRLVDAEFRLRSPGDGWRWTNVRAAPVLTAGGAIERWVGVNIDIDERKRGEAVLQEREADLARVQRIGAVGGLDIDVAGGMISRRSPEYLRLHGLPLDARDETHAEWRSRVHPDDVEKAERHLFSSLASDARSYESEYRIIRPSDGAVRWIAARTDIERDKSGKAIRMVGAHIDITEQRHAQEALRESEQRYRLMFETMDEGYLVADVIFDEEDQPVDIEYIRANPAATRMIGKDLTGRRLRSVGNYEEYWYEIWGRVAQTGIPETLERYAAPDKIWYDFHVFKVDPEDVGSRRVAVLFKDVTRRRLVEHALRESEARFRTLAETAPVLIWRNDARGENLFVNKRFADYTGKSPAELQGDAWQALVHPDDAEAYIASYMQAVEEQRAWQNRNRIRRQDGVWRWFENYAQPLFDQQERYAGHVGVSADVTDMVLAGHALRESEERFQQFARASSAGLWIRDAGTLAMEFVSPAVGTFYGVETDALLGDAERWVLMIVPEDREAAIERLKEAREGQIAVYEFRIRRPSDGATRWIRNTEFPLHDAQGRIQRIGGIAEDITGAKLAADRQDVLVAELQHRTRNLIAVVKGIADDTMRETGPTLAFRGAFSDRLSALSRVQGLLSRSEVEPITIGALVRLELDAIGASASGDRVSVEGPEVFLRPSSVQTLALALHELATNARKYGALSHDGGHLAVRWRKRSEAGERRLALEWLETGLEQVSHRSASERVGGGYGRELIEQALPHALGARTSYALSASGVCCMIDLAVRPGKVEP